MDERRNEMDMKWEKETGWGKNLKRKKGLKYNKGRMCLKTVLKSKPNL